MGMTPLEGLVMGTRTGDIDPAVTFYLQRVAGMSVDDVDELMNRRSGLKGLTGDNDMRQVRDIARSGDHSARKRAREALNIYVNRIVKYIGAYTAEMGGLDVLTFTAGIGENDIDLRREVCQRLEPLGLLLDEEANGQRPRDAITISRKGSVVRVMVVPTNEELAIATQAMTVV
jgi:acetate kinase